MKLKKAIFWICIFLTLVGCGYSSQSITGDVFQVEFVKGPDLHLEYVKELNIYRSETLEFWIKNTSQACITFPYNFGIRIYYENNGAWVEVGNEFQYLPNVQDIEIQPSGQLFSQNDIELVPDIHNIQITSTAKFKADIQGYLCKDKKVVVEKEIPFTVSP